MNQWYCKIGDHVFGPISAAELKQWIQDRRIAPSDMVRIGESGQWASAKDIKGIVWPEAPPTPQQTPAHAGATPDALEFLADAPDGVAGRKPYRLSKTPTNWLAIFDWKFEYYLTPWIVRIVWIIFLASTFSIFLISAFTLVVSLLPEFSSAVPASPWRPHESPSPDFLPSWLALRLVKVVLFAAYTVWTTMGILMMRMILEMIIVVFRIAEDIGVLKRKYAPSA
jgi:hypothetical protein